MVDATNDTYRIYELLSGLKLGQIGLQRPKNSQGDRGRTFLRKKPRCERKRSMASQLTIEREETIFKKRRGKLGEQWFVRVSCNLFEPRIFGPFLAEQEAEHFREGAEFELRKLLDCQLPHLSEEFQLSPPRVEL